MQTEYIYPTVGNRLSPKECEEVQRPLLLDKATLRKDEILSRAPILIDPALDQAIRSEYRMYFNA